MNLISSGATGEVWGLGGSNKIYRREGVMKKSPSGSKWKQVQGNLTQLEMFEGKVWGVNSLQEVWNANVSGSGGNWKQAF